MVAREHDPQGTGAQAPVSSRGPQPDVLARLSVGAAEAQAPRGRSARARLLGIVLCAITAGTVLGAVIAVGAP